jgi:hypothetical protein
MLKSHFLSLDIGVDLLASLARLPAAPERKRQKRQGRGAQRQEKLFFASWAKR